MADAMFRPRSAAVSGAAPGDAPPPCVSIGLPVFNGERYLAEAIDSILGQDFTDLELIVCDNASTDGTQAICERYAARDKRLRYFRNLANLGAGPNYDLCFHHARGTYFKWAAHDDCLGQGYLRQAVAALEALPDAVLCTVGITEIGPDSEARRRYANHFPGIDAPDPATRFNAIINTRHQCEDFFGLYRRAALVGTGLHGTYTGSDRVLLAELALRGPWVSVPEPLFRHREHDGRYTRAILLKDREAAALWQDTARPVKRGGNRHFHLVVYRHYLRAIGRTALAPRDRLACYGVMARWWAADGHAVDVVRDLLRDSPALRRPARAIRRLLRGRERAATARPGSLPDLG